MSNINLGSGTNYFRDLEDDVLDDKPMVIAGSVSSDSATDSVGLGTGATAIQFIYLNDSYVGQTPEVVLMNGTTGVNTVATDILRIQDIQVVGGVANVGNIYIGTGTITGGKPANVYGMIPAGKSSSNTMVQTVPDGFNAYPVASGVSCKNTEHIESIVTVTLNGIRYQKGGRFSTENDPVVQYNFGLPIPEHSDIMMEVKAVSGTADVYGHAEFILVPNS